MTGGARPARRGDPGPAPHAPGLTRPAEEPPAVPVDLRLAGPAVGAWLAAWWCLGQLPVAAFTLAGAAALAGLLTLVGRGRPGHRRAAVRVAALCLVGVAAGSACCGARLLTRDAGPLAALAERRATVRVELVVRDDPRPVGDAAGGRAVYAVSASLHAFEEAGRSTRAGGRVLVLAADAGWRTLLPGQRLTADGRLAPPRGGDLTAAVLSARGPPRTHGLPPAWQRAAGGLRAGLQRACADLPVEPGGLLPGLAVGDTSRLDPTVEESFLASGMTHLTAVSGANLAIVAGLVVVLGRWCRAGPATTALLTAAAIAGFVVLARPSPSVVRAAAMCGVGLLALALGRPRAAVPALAASVLVLVLADPSLAGSPGFALSASATAGLLLLAPPWAEALRRRGVPEVLAQALAVPAGAQAACAPLLAAMTGAVSLSAVPANLVAMPAVAPATVLGVLAAACSVVLPPAAAVLAWLGSWPAWWLVLVARVGGALPAGSVPWPDRATGGWLLAVLLVALVWACRHRPVRRVVIVAALAVAVAAVPVRLVAPGWPPVGWVVVGCDVGQGDALALRAGPDSAVVVDAGPEPAAVDRCLRRLSIRRVPLLAVSHLHADHVGGLAGVVRGRGVGAIGTGPLDEPVAGFTALTRIARSRAVPVLRLRAGGRLRLGDVRIAVLGPAVVSRGTRSDPNNASVVLRAEVAGVSVLLAGDTEQEAEEALLASGQELRADVLKVPHHGSSHSSPAFLDAVDPRVAIVEVGVDNDYGHPSPGVLRHLERGGARVLRTDRDGDVAVVRRGSGLVTVVRRPDAVERRT